MRKLLVSTALGLMALCTVPNIGMAQEHRDAHSDRRGNNNAAPAANGQARNPQPGEPGFNRGNAPPPGVAVAPPGAMPPGFGGARAAAPAAAPANRGNQNNNFDNNRRNNNFGNNNNNSRRNDNNFRGNNKRNTRFNSRYNGRQDFGGFHRNFTAPRHFRAGNYNRPRGWYSHRWTFGEFLPLAFYANNYWLNDYQRYDLPPPPYGTIWVRVNDDALLIDQDDGEVIQVAYGVFY